MLAGLYDEFGGGGVIFLIVIEGLGGDFAERFGGGCDFDAPGFGVVCAIEPDEEAE